MMMQEAVKNRELVSALADGQLRGEEFASTIEWVGHSEDARLTWHAYHLVGDVLRSGEAVDSGGDAAFLTRLKLGLQREAPLAPREDAIDLVADYAISTAAGDINHLQNVSANDTSFRWKLLAGFASLAAVSIIGWQASSGWGDQSAASQLAQGPVQTVAGGEALIMVRDPQLDALLAAHKQFGGTSALQMPAGFLRNATFEGAAR
jgi:sigma-E factor negative regulatory protein RseA